MMKMTRPLTIREKVIISYMLLIMILAWLIGNLLYSNYTLAQSYNELMGDLVDLNNISQEIDNSMESIDRLLLTRSTVYIDRYYSHMYDAGAEMVVFENGNISEENYYRMKDLRQLMVSYQGYCEKTYTIALSSNDERYIENYNDAQRIYGYMKALIQETYDGISEKGFSNYEQMENYNNLMWWIFTILFVIMVLGASVYAYEFSKEITKNIHELTEASKRISKGYFDLVELKGTPDEEISILAGAFNKMVINTRRLMHEIQRKADLEKEAQFKALQAQINPHFLFNTLNVIDKLALIEGADRTCELIESLSDLLRYNLRRIDAHVTLQDEIYNIREYVNIQKARFSDRLEYIEDIDENLLPYTLPALSLQPVIENAFKHGLEGSEEKGEIRLTIKEFNEKIIIEVWDNGKGIDKSVLSGEKKSTSKGHTTGIGVDNVRQRLNLYFKEKSQFIMENHEQGAVVKMIIPKVRGEGYV
jgi:sensor histidine kinase YesM